LLALTTAALAGCAAGGPRRSDVDSGRQIEVLQAQVADLSARLERSELALIAVSARTRTTTTAEAVGRAGPGRVPPDPVPGSEAAFAARTGVAADPRPGPIADPARFRWALTTRRAPDPASR
jgi:hypothetical protein